MKFKLRNEKVMKKIYIILLFVMICVYSCSAPKSSLRDMSALNDEMFFAQPVVSYDADSNKAIIVLYLEVPIENLLFKMNYQSENYESQIKISVSITNQKDENILSESHDESSAYSEIEIKERIKESQYYIYKYYVEPGDYKVNIKMKDGNSDKEYLKSVDLSVKDFKSKDVTSSDLLVLSKFKVNQDGTKEITPLIRNNIFGLKDVHFFFEIYNNTDKEITKDFLTVLADSQGTLLKVDTLSYTLSPGVNRKIESISINRKLIEEPRQNKKGARQNLFFKIEIRDKATNEILSGGKIFYYSKYQRLEMPKRPY